MIWERINNFSCFSARSSSPNSFIRVFLSLWICLSYTNISRVWLVTVWLKHEFYCNAIKLGFLLVYILLISASLETLLFLLRRFEQSYGVSEGNWISCCRESAIGNMSFAMKFICVAVVFLLSLFQNDHWRFEVISLTSLKIFKLRSALVASATWILQLTSSLFPPVYKSAFLPSGYVHSMIYSRNWLSLTSVVLGDRLKPQMYLSCQIWNQECRRKHKSLHSDHVLVRTWWNNNIMGDFSVFFFCFIIIVIVIP